MLKVRIIPTLLYKNLGLVKGVGFDSWRRLGSALQAIKVYSLREVDELLFLDISATRENRPPDFATIDDLADECFMPLTVGGGVRSLEDVRRLLMVGADKVAINTALVERPAIVAEITSRFGSQCIVASIDFKMREDGTREVYTHSGTKGTGLDPVTLACRVEQLGAGEILLTCIDRDGAMTGYDLEGLRQVCDAVSIPVIASGGAGNYEHLYEALTVGRASALAAASIFHFTEQTPLEAKLYLKARGVSVRV